MKNKNVVLIAAVLVSLFYFAAIVYCGPIEVLFKHREYLERQAQTCEPSEKERYTFEQHPRGETEYKQKIHIIALFKEMNKKSLYDWNKKYSNEIIDAFLQLCMYRISGGTHDRGCYNNEETQYIRLTDTVLINILVETLGELPKTKDRDVLDCLKAVPYPYLNNYRTKIIDKLKKIKDFNRFRYLAAVIDPPLAMKKELLASDSLSIGMRARLGDKGCENELMRRANGEDENRAIYPYIYPHRYSLIDELFLCGNDDCLKWAFELFVTSKPIMKIIRTEYLADEQRINHIISKRCTDESSVQRVRIIRGFRKYYPELDLLHKEYQDVYTHVKVLRSADSWDVVAEYMKKFTDWGNKEYGADLKLQDGYLFGGQCDDEYYKTRKRGRSERQ